MRTEASPDAIPAVASGTVKRFGVNLVTNVGRLVLTLLIGVWYVPFLVKHLGPAAYGLVPLASTITSYMGLVTFSLEAAVARYMMISIQQKDDRQANTVFNVAVWGNFALACLLGILATVAIANIQHIIRIPSGYITATRWLFAGTVAAFLLNQIRSPFLVSAFCLNRIDLQNSVNVAATLTRTGLAVLLFLVVAPKIEFVGAAIFVGTIVSAIGAVWVWRRLTPNLHIRLHDFDFGILKNLYNTGGWIFIGQVGLMLYANIDLLLSNRLFGPVQGGRYAAALQLPTLLKALGFAVGEIFIPTMYQKYAQGNFDRLAAYLNQAMKFVGLTMALTIGLICGFSKPLLELWLGPTFGNMAPLLFIMAIHLSINLSMYPLYAVPLAANKVKMPGIAILGFGLVNLALALFLARIWGLYGIAAAGAISLTLRNLIFTPIYGAIILKRPYGTFYKMAIPVTLATFATIGLCRLVLLGWTISTWVELGAASATVSLMFLGVAYLLLNSAERTALKTTVSEYGKRLYGRSI